MPMHPPTPSPSVRSAPPGAPFALTARLMEKVWGGQRLAGLGKFLPDPQARYGESWELADMPSTSASGAGGGSVRTAIASGPLQGRTLREAIAVWGTALLGDRAPTPAGDFPLLVKFLDACENLSVQVHPSPAYAAGHAGAHVKTECWYILAAEPGSVIYKGLRAGVDPEKFAARCRAGDPGLVKDLMAAPAIPGECHNLPSGTVHALGAGVLVAEVQTPSDTTYRLYDWGRKGREMHVEEGLACATYDEPPAATKLRGPRMSRLVTTEFFTLDGVERPGTSPGVIPELITIPTEGKCTVVMVIEGRGGLETAGNDTLTLNAGDTAVIPAACDDFYVAAAAPMRILIARI